MLKLNPGKLTFEGSEHNCLDLLAYNSVQAKALNDVTEKLRGYLSVVRGQNVNREAIDEIILFGDVAPEFDEYLPLGAKLDSFRNIHGFAVGFRAGHCGYYCGSSGNCTLAKLWSREPNYSHEDPEKLRRVLDRYAEKIPFDSELFQDAVLRCFMEYKYLRNLKSGKNMDLDEALFRFQSQYNPLFFRLGFDSGSNTQFENPILSNAASSSKQVLAIS